MPKKFIVYGLSFIVLILFNVQPAFAQIATPSAITTPLPPAVYPTSPLYTDLLIHNMFHSFSCIAIGQSIIGQPCLSYQMTQNAQGVLQGVPVLSQANLSGGALGAATSLIGALYQNPPVRTADYLASVSGFGVVREANAQVGGSGAAVLNPILRLWQVSRNISYVIMILIFMVIGLMIMFRNKINPQTVITAQAALPGLVIGLIMITFSYFLAGLISDMAFVGTNVVGYYFTAVRGELNNPPAEQLNLANTIQRQNILDIFSPFAGVMGRDEIANALAGIWPSLENPSRSNNPFDPNFMDPSRAITAISAMLMTQLIAPFGNMFGGVGQIFTAVAGGGYTVLNPRGTVSFALSFVAMVILIYTMFRLLLRLVNNYLTIIFLTFSAPFQFLFASLPGRQGIATGWMLNMLANILAFPAVLAVLYFVAFLLGPNVINQHCATPCPFKVSQSNQIENNGLVSNAYAQGQVNIVDSSTFPLFGGIDLDFLRIILAFGALVALPAIPDIVNRTVGKVSQAGELIGREIGSGIGEGRRYTGQFQQGIGGFAGQVGQLSDKPGYFGTYVPKATDSLTGKVTPAHVAWEKTYDPRFGAQAGSWTRTVTGFKSLVGRGSIKKS